MLALAALLVAAAPLAQERADARFHDVVVGTTSGPIAGLAADEHGVVRFLGVPYAAPPVGELRWRAARPPEPWIQPRPCTSFSLAAAQPEPRSYQNIGARGEDCLYLNVFAPAPPKDERGNAALAPVLLFVHGGGFTRGTAMSPNYDGSVLASEGLCVVVPNYRLGPFGFLTHPAFARAGNVGGNQALSDVVRALEWVRDNAAAFGGDPTNVTIAGQSAGAEAVAALMTSEEARGLFHRAIVLSGGGPPDVSPPGADLSGGGPRKGDDAHNTMLLERNGLGFAAALEDHLDRDRPGAKALLAASTDEVLAAWGATVAEVGRIDLCYGTAFLARNPVDVFAAHEQAAVPLMVGATGDDAAMFLGRILVDDMAGYDAWLASTFGEHVERARELYPASTLEEARAQQRRYGNDLYEAGVRATARAQSAVAPTYRYRFTRVSPFGEALGMGAFHGAELAYLFGRVEEGDDYTTEDVELARTMRAQLVTFCRTGDPNGEGLPEWPRFVAATGAYLELDLEPHASRDRRTEQCDLIDAASRLRR